MKKLSILIVTYKSNLSASLSIQSIMNIKCIDYKPDLHVWMNNYTDEDDYLDSKIYDKFNVIISKSEKNEKLSCVYNNFINNNINDYSILLDQDSILPADFITEVDYVINNHDVRLAIPKVYHDNLLVSPGKLNYIKGQLVQKFSNVSGFIDSKNILAINSGMIIDNKMQELKKVIFDERLGFYFTDTKYMIDYFNKNNSIYLLNACIKHDLSEFSEKDNIEKALFRYDEINKGYRITFPKGFDRLMVELYIIYRGVKFMCRYKSIEFLRRI